MEEIVHPSKISRKLWSGSPRLPTSFRAGAVNVNVVSNLSKYVYQSTEDVKLSPQQSQFELELVEEPPDPPDAESAVTSVVGPVLPIEVNDTPADPPAVKVADVERIDFEGEDVAIRLRPVSPRVERTPERVEELTVECSIRPSRPRDSELDLVIAPSKQHMVSEMLLEDKQLKLQVRPIDQFVGQLTNGQTRSKSRRSRASVGKSVSVVETPSRRSSQLQVALRNAYDAATIASNSMNFSTACLGAKENLMNFSNVYPEVKERSTSFSNACLKTKERSSNFSNAYLEAKERSTSSSKACRNACDAAIMASNSMNFSTACLETKEYSTNFSNAYPEAKERSTSFSNACLETQECSSNFSNAYLQPKERLVNFSNACLDATEPSAVSNESFSSKPDVKKSSEPRGPMTSAVSSSGTSSAKKAARAAAKAQLPEEAFALPETELKPLKTDVYYYREKVAHERRQIDNLTKEIGQAESLFSEYEQRKLKLADECDSHRDEFDRLLQDFRAAASATKVANADTGLNRLITDYFVKYYDSLAKKIEQFHRERSALSMVIGNLNEEQTQLQKHVAHFEQRLAQRS